MKRITREELDEFLRKHKLWLEDKEGGERAYLRGADLRGADLRGADLRGADLSNADLRGADLSNAYLRGADLSNADLRGADLSNAYLRGAYLSNADLSNADLRGADLSNAYLRGADLSGADLNDVKLPLACPEKGSFVGFKKCLGNRIVELEILSDSKRSSATTRKCRCSKARVISITDIDGSTTYEEAVSSYDLNFKYRVGTTVVADNFDECRWNECSTGIHFFITRQEAVDYCV